MTKKQKPARTRPPSPGRPGMALPQTTMTDDELAHWFRTIPRRDRQLTHDALVLDRDRAIQTVVFCVRRLRVLGQVLAEPDTPAAPPADLDEDDPHLAQLRELIRQIIVRARASPPEDIDQLIDEFEPLIDFVMSGP